MAPTDDSGMLGDDFFDVVRRRHPDIDIVLLPPEEPADLLADPADEVLERTDPATLDDLADLIAGELQTLWSAVTADIEMNEATSRWSYGGVAGSLSHESLAAATDVDDVAAHQALARAERVLGDSGWHMLVPPEGMPRVLASRTGDDAGRECQIVYVPMTARFAMTYSAGPFIVGEAAARATVEAAP